MLNRTKTIHPSVFYATIAGVSYVIGETTGSAVLGTAGFLGTAIFAAASTVAFVEYLADWTTVAWARIREAQKITREGYLAAQIATLDPEGRRILRELIQGDVLGSEGSGANYDGVFVPDSFIRELIAGSSGGFLAAERLWSEGSRGRDWYKAVSRFLIRRGVAERARGNRPVRLLRPWRDVQMVLNTAEIVNEPREVEMGEWVKVN